MIRLLLDTHVFIWWRADDARLNHAARHAIAHADVVQVSAASAWEAGIKQALGRLKLPELFATGVRESGFEPLPIDFSHVREAAALPPHHRDPFDRVLVAQARVEGLTLITHDELLTRYDVSTLMT